MQATVTVQRTYTVLEEIADPFLDVSTGVRELAGGRDRGSETSSPTRTSGGRRYWVVLDSSWGKRLGAERHGAMYRLPRREFVKRMAEI